MGIHDEQRHPRDIVGNARARAATAQEPSQEDGVAALLRREDPYAAQAFAAASSPMSAVSLDAELYLEDAWAIGNGRNQNRSRASGPRPLTGTPRPRACPRGRDHTSAGGSAAAHRRPRRHFDFVTRGRARHRPFDRKPEPGWPRTKGVDCPPPRRRRRSSNRCSAHTARQTNGRYRVRGVGHRLWSIARSPSARRAPTDRRGD
jgi:hypothetical protein